jgi:hypothetical protein
MHDSFPETRALIKDDIVDALTTLIGMARSEQHDGEQEGNDHKSYLEAVACVESVPNKDKDCISSKKTAKSHEALSRSKKICLRNVKKSDFGKKSLSALSFVPVASDTSTILDQFVDSHASEKICSTSVDFFDLIQKINSRKIGNFLV